MGVGCKIIRLVIAQARSKGEESVFDGVEFASGEDSDGVVARRSTTQIRRRIAAQTRIYALKGTNK